MTNDLSTALETLRLDPEDRQARDILAGLSEREADGPAPEEVVLALAAARGWHAEANRPGLCVLLVDAELGLTREPAARAELLVEKARLLWRDLWQTDPARETVREALQLAPEHAAAAELLKSFEVEDGGWQEQAEALSEKAAAAGEGPEGAVIFVEEAELLLRHRNLSDEAEALLRRSLAIDPHNRRADFALERLLRASGRHPELALHLARRSASAKSPEEKAEAELAAGRLAEQTGQSAQAQEHYQRALAACPGDERARRALEKGVAGATSTSSSRPTRPPSRRPSGGPPRSRRPWPWARSTGSGSESSRKPSRTSAG